jgi:hypothetical protein
VLINEEYLFIDKFHTSTRWKIKCIKKKKNRGNEPLWVIIHTHMEMLQGKSLCSYLKQTNTSFFFIYKVRENKSGIGYAWEWLGNRGGR